MDLNEHELIAAYPASGDVNPRLGSWGWARQGRRRVNIAWQWGVRRCSWSLIVPAVRQCLAEHEGDWYEGRLSRCSPTIWKPCGGHDLARASSGCMYGSQLMKRVAETKATWYNRVID